uniref:Uncharacterized protein n=1 Tax=Ixodes ricinus TaxID=34613 RepID=A0A6B0UCP6_IXORI
MQGFESVSNIYKQKKKKKGALREFAHTAPPNKVCLPPSETFCDTTHSSCRKRCERNGRLVKLLGNSAMCCRCYCSARSGSAKIVATLHRALRSQILFWSPPF